MPIPFVFVLRARFKKGVYRSLQGGKNGKYGKIEKCIKQLEKKDQNLIPVREYAEKNLQIEETFDSEEEQSNFAESNQIAGLNVKASQDTGPEKLSF